MSKRKKKPSAYYEQNRIKAKHKRCNASTEPETEVILCKSGPDWYRKYAAHVIDAFTFIVIYAVGFLILLLAGAAVWIGSRPAVWTKETMKPMEVTFDHYVDDGAFCLYSNTEDVPFYIYCSDTQTKQRLIDGCFHKTPYKILAEIHGNPARYYQIAEMIDMDGVSIINLEESNQALEQEYRQLRRILLAIIAGLMLLWACFVSASIAVGCAPERHSRFLVHLLYRSGSIVYIDMDKAIVR